MVNLGKSEYWLTSLIEKSFRVQSVLKFYNFVGGKKRRREFGNDYDLDSPSPWLTWDGIGFDKDLGPMGDPGNPMGSRENPIGLKRSEAHTSTGRRGEDKILELTEQRNLEN